MQMIKRKNLISRGPEVNQKRRSTPDLNSRVSLAGVLVVVLPWAEEVARSVCAGRALVGDPCSSWGGAVWRPEPASGQLDGGPGEWRGAGAWETGAARRGGRRQRARWERRI